MNLNSSSRRRARVIFLSSSLFFFLLSLDLVLLLEGRLEMVLSRKNKLCWWRIITGHFYCSPDSFVLCFASPKQSHQSEGLSPAGRTADACPLAGGFLSFDALQMCISPGALATRPSSY